MKYSTRQYSIVLSALLLMAPASDVWSDDAMQMLEQEAARLNIDEATVHGSPKAISSYRSDRYEQFMSQRRIVPSGFSQQELKLYLFKEYFETYANYSELDKQQQKQVYAFYKQQDNASVSAIDDKILELLPRE